MAIAGVAAMLLWASAAPAMAHRPPEPGEATAAGTPKRDQGHGDKEAPSRLRALLTAERGSIGFDISFPQCNGPFPKNADFKIVGVNRGKAFTANPCLGTGDGPSQLRWAGRHAWLYANTGSPGPRLSDHWPIGQRFPRRCTRDAPLSTGCAYDYGWDAARQSYRTALRAYISLGWAPPGATHTPVRNRWWLDVETGNSWLPNERLNVATLRGAVDYLESRHAASVGFYSAKFMWADITGRTQAFAEYPSWVAGASTLTGAKRYCAGAGFTGGGVALAQFWRNGFDADYAC
jgi:hypothetical protein